MAKAKEQTIINEDQTVTDFSVKSETDDFVLIVEGKNIFVPKLVLISASPVFNKMFKSDFKGKNQDELVLKNKKYGDVLEFLKCIHPTILAPITMSNVFAVVPLAHEYLVHPLKKQCDVVVTSYTSQSTSVEKLCYYLYIANKFQLETLENTCRIIAGELSCKKEGAKFSAAAEKYQVPFESQAIIYKAMWSKLAYNIDKECTDLRDIRCPKCYKDISMAYTISIFERHL